ncbi:MAG TPA: hypothetical protein VGK21_06085 [Candidatus Angelobacter sp.]|jgi:hypothetical protein
MSPFVRKLARGIVLALILVLTGSANLLCLSVDNDDDDDTAPVSIEFSFVALSHCSLPRGTSTNRPASNATVKPQATGQQTAPSQDSPHEAACADFRPLRC